jgi:hypothetical protein
MKFHENAILPADGSTYQVVSDASEMAIDFKGTGTFKALIQGKVSYESDWDDLMVTSAKDYAIMTTTPSTFDIYKLDLTGLRYVRCKLIEMIDANITVLVRAVG